MTEKVKFIIAIIGVILSIIGIALSLAVALRLLFIMRNILQQ